jgi:hypothetical protein
MLHSAHMDGDDEPNSFRTLGAVTLKVLESLVTEPENQKQNDRSEQCPRKCAGKEGEEGASERVTADLLHVNNPHS